MKTIRITFHKCYQDTRSAGSDERRMVSRVFLTLDVGGRRIPDLHVDIAQKAGSTFSTGALEIGPLAGYSGPMNDWAFRKAVEDYYRGLASRELPRVKTSFGRPARRMENIVSHETSVEVEIYD